VSRTAGTVNRAAPPQTRMATATVGPDVTEPGVAEPGAPEPGARDRVLDAAVELFAEQGYDGTSVAQVIDRAELTKGGFYHHFASKEALLYEVYGDLISRQLEAMEEILARGEPPAATLRALILDLVQTTAASARRAQVFASERNKLAGERAADFRRARRRYHDAVKELIRSAQQDGTFAAVASAETVTFSVFGVINELPLWYRADGGKSPTELGTELADFFLAALVVRA